MNSITLPSFNPYKGSQNTNTIPSRLLVNVLLG